MRHTTKKEFNDLLIPIILILSLLPFITRLIMYDSGLSSYPWYSNDDIVSDFFSYYKSYVFIIIAIVSAIILIFYFIFQRNHIKKMKSFILLGIYSFAILLSTLFSVDQRMSMIGGIAHFESTLVLLGYVIIVIYTYQIEKKEEDYQVLLKALIISLIVMCMIGSFQMIGKDLISLQWVQKLIIPRQYWSEFLGNITNHLSSNAVSLTLFNPNFAAVYIAMMIPFLIAQLLPSVKKKERILYIIIIAFLTLLLFKTYSRTGLISTVVSLIVLGYFYRSYLQKHWKKYCIAGVLAASMFVSLDYVNHFRYIDKIIRTFGSFREDNQNVGLEEIQTNQNQIMIQYNGEKVMVSFSEDASSDVSLQFHNAAGDSLNKYYDSTSKLLNWKQFDEVQFYIEQYENKNYIDCVIQEITWSFYFDSQNGYRYVNDFGKTDKLGKVEQFGFKDLEQIGSGRGYIWSCSIPLLKDTLFLGKGPDTYSIVFPQSDYVGKANNCKTPYTLIEKPHNLYLMIGIQTGVISLIVLLCFYFYYMINSFQLYRNNSFTSSKDRIAIGCFVATISYMISGLFNDSSLQTTPIFCVLLGLGLDINYQSRRDANLLTNKSN